MPNQFTEITRKSRGSRMGSSIKGILIGLVMFIVSFGVLYRNEGRVNVANIAKTAVEIDATVLAETGVDGQLISTTNVLKSEEKLGDTFLKVGDYIAFHRVVEMFAWEENTRSSSDENLGGSETTETTYTYDKVWTDSPENSTDFKYPDEHRNPQMTIKAKGARVKNAKIGVYKVNMSELDLSKFQDVTLTDSNVILTQGVKRADDYYLFQGKGTIDIPEIGDLRISYEVVKNPVDPATLFGKLNLADQTIVPFIGKKDTKLYRVFEGSRTDAIATMNFEHKLLSRILRIVGFFLMRFGLMTLLRPITTFLSVIPIAGSIGRTGIGIATFVVALVLSIITILVSIIFHNIIALIIVAAAAIVAIIIYAKNRKKKPENSVKKM